MSNNEFVRVKDMMTKKVTSLSPDDGLDRAAELFDDPSHDGFPVVNADGKLVGIVTAYDMVSQSYATHLPPLLHILESLYNNKAEKKEFEEHFDRIKTIKIRDMMNEDPLVVGPEVSIEDLAKEFLQHHRVNPIPVVDADRNLLGIVSRSDLIRFFDQKYLHNMLVESGHEGILQRLGRLGDK